mmetsp:Transcript_12013/g.17933  ORF Transcript_12013/g.17933 Transcript_12013/m.17933 type:complete len:353 (-) Transcript_12013:28-1086(-)
MGGDGGTISSNRTYLRGAGKACHTADHPSNAAKRAKLEDTEQARLILTTCAISGIVLDLTPSKQQHGNNRCSGADIVVCPYGKLYKREEALEALLRRSQQINSGGVDALGSHVRGMKDLHPVRFYVTTSASSNGGNSDNNGNGRGTMARYTVTCPITSGEIGSGNVPSFVIVRSKNPKSKDKKKGSPSNNDNDETDGIEVSPNVISERAIKEMGIDGLQSEYGPFEERNMIRLAPPKAGGVFEEIQRKWEARVEEERVAKMQKKKDKKRKRGTTNEDVSAKTKSETKTSLPVVAAAASASIQGKKTSVADEARSNIQTKVANNSVLSSLFGGAGKKIQTEKEKRDALFTRNC